MREIWGGGRVLAVGKVGPGGWDMGGCVNRSHPYANLVSSAPVPFRSVPHR